MESDHRAKFRMILDNYMSIINSSLDEYTSRSKILKLPLVPKEILFELITAVTEIFKKEPNIVPVPPNTIVVGDLHGHILDLFRIIRRFHLPPMKSYVFLGDYVDRGEFSTETITLVYVLKVLYPTRVFLIRGNHEFAEMCMYSGFIYEIDSVYTSSDVGEAFIDSFSFMPLAANIDDYAICLHGGLGEKFKSLEQLAAIERPIIDYNDPVVSECLWSDPSRDICGLEPSPRGLGFLFGQSVTEAFLRNNKKDILVRGHQCVEMGIEKVHNEKLITVFSASRYCDCNFNHMGVLLVKYKQYEEFTFPPLPYLRRPEVQFVPLLQRRSNEAPVFSSKKLGVKNKETMSNPQLPGFNIHLPPTMHHVSSQGAAPTQERSATAPRSARATRYLRLFELSIKKPVDTQSKAPKRVREPDYAPPFACRPRIKHV